MRKLSRFLGALVSWVALACTPPVAAPPPRVPEPAAEPTSQGSAVAPPAAPAPRSMPVAPAAVPKVSCSPFDAAPPAECAEPGLASELLSRAFQHDEDLARYAAVSALQHCDAFAPGLILALRAELAAPECADAIIGATVAPDVAPELADTLTALVHGAHLSRLGFTPPQLEPPFSKQEFAEFSKTVLEEWIVTQAQAIYQIAKSGSTLSGYARGVVAVEAGIADLRFVTLVRDVPLPEELSRDPELRDAYYAELDVALAPWKERGRDAALVGLRELAAVGVLDAPRLTRARAALSQVYGGRRIDRLDGLILPAPFAVASGAEQFLAGHLPTYYVPYVLPNLDASQPALLTLLLRRGLPQGIRADLMSRPVSAEANFALGWGLVRLGQTYWTAADFTAAEAVLRRPPQAATGESELLLAIVQALKAGPRDAVEMMARGSVPLGTSGVAALDTLALGKGPWAAAAGFDAAYILELWPPAGDPIFWKELAQRYSRAEARLSDAAEKARANERAKAAQATAKSMLPARP